MSILGKLAIGIVGLGIYAAATADHAPPSPDAIAAAAARRDACQPYGNVAAAAWELAQRGIREDVAIRAATSRVTDARLLPLVRDAVHQGYQTRTQPGAKDRALSFCIAGTLGR